MIGLIARHEETPEDERIRILAEALSARWMRRLKEGDGGAQNAADDLLRSMARGGLIVNGYDLLSNHELQVLKRFSWGWTAQQIADLRCVSRETVKSQAASIRFKLRAKSMTHAVSIATRSGLI